MRAFLAGVALMCGTQLCAQSSMVTGYYMEDRSNRVYGCPCEWSDEFVQKGRDAVLAWSITSGEHAGRGLAGLKLAAVVSGDDTLSVPLTPRRAVVFIDSAAPSAQRQAGESWLRSRFGDLIGQVREVHAEPIELRFTPESVNLRIRNVLLLQMRRAVMSTDTENWADLLYEPFIALDSPAMGTTLKTHYTAPDLRRQWKREEVAITGYYGRFGAPAK
jgi:hypothetical protein